MNNLSNIWTHSNCLTKSQLINYIKQNLDRDEVYLVESHLNDCPICSDALDGIIDEDLDIVQADLSEIKLKVEQKIQELHPIEKPLLTVNHRINKETQHKPISNLSSKKTDIKKWLVAASVLILMGLGGYSVFSYIKSQDQQLAQNKNSEEKKEADYNQPNDPNANEITTLRVNPPDSFSKPSMQDEKYIPKKDEPQPISVTKSPNEINNKPEPPTVIKEEENIQESSTVSGKEALKDRDNSKRLEEKDNALDESITNYQEDIKAKNVQPAYAGKKKTVVGLSNSKNIATQNSRELSYPSPSNNNNNIQNNDVNNSQTKYLEKESNLSDYDMAMDNFNKGNFKTSIDYFQKALKIAKGEQKEDIQFHLAQAYLQTGKRNKAEKLFEELALGTKYKREASEQLIRAKK